MVSILVGTIMNVLFVASITASITVFVIDEAANPERSRKVSIRTLISFLWAGLKMVASHYKGSTISSTRVSFHLRANHITRIPLPPMVITPLVKIYYAVDKKKNFGPQPLSQSFLTFFASADLLLAALGSKPPLLTRIARIGLGMRPGDPKCCPL